MPPSPFAEFQPLAAIATTPAALRQLQPLCRASGATLWVPPALGDWEGTCCYSGPLKEHLAALWPQHRGFVFGLATGAVVRLIAPLLADKSHDPAVAVVDERAQFAISLCGGHRGGADRLTRLIARHLDATPVLTGGAEGADLPGADTLGLPFGWRRGEGDWTAVSAAIARGERVRVVQTAGSRLWQSHLPAGHPLVFEPQAEPVAAQIRIEADASAPAQVPTVAWHPRVLWLGIGCERGTPQSQIEAAIAQACQQYGLVQAAIAGIATIERKTDEAGLLGLCRDRGWPLKAFPAASLRSVAAPTPSATVEAAMGTPSVAESAALLAVGAVDGTAPDAGALRVPKQISKTPAQPGAVTLAIAQASVEWTGRTGQLLLVGMGPGALEHMTPAAQAAVTGADAVVGYARYVEAIAALLAPGQIVEPFAITQEQQRAQRAIALARWGLTVAVVSSGDAGIYGMAGLVLEELQGSGWDGRTPQLEVIPGITAMQAAAARVGAPLMHDFCAVSLSDLLAPWSLIRQRLEAAARADFSVALYNPRSQNRPDHIRAARDILLAHRDPATPVALVRSAYRDGEQTVLTTLERMLEVPIDMLTVVLVGNRSSRCDGRWMLAPRGYRGFERDA
ncbi:MAG: precorrin-3B C(17)-methyltransferase [Cyanobacteria bacterium QS_8_64_29]|nr:MAG: precorrin-3B C(17)-methyltransferase [Cyanobacteria bacterium QS_8_64_29]